MLDPAEGLQLFFFQDVFSGCKVMGSTKHSKVTRIMRQTVGRIFCISAIDDCEHEANLCCRFRRRKRCDCQSLRRAFARFDFGLMAKSRFEVRAKDILRLAPLPIAVKSACPHDDDDFFSVRRKKIALHFEAISQTGCH